MADSSVAIPRPAHVPPALVYDFDISHDPLLQSNMHLGLIELARRTPEIFWTPRYGGHWIARSYEAIFEAAADPQTFSSDLTKISDHRMMLPILLDPPEHHPYRKILLGVFSPKSVGALLPRIRELTQSVTSRLAKIGHCEFVSEVSEIIPVTVFMELAGIPLEMRMPLRKLVTASMLEGHHEQRDKLFGEMAALLQDIIRARVNTREEDIISRLMDAEVDGRPLTLEEITSFILLLTTAGLDTVTNTMSFIARHLAMDEALQQEIRSKPSSIPDLIEEMLRRYSVSSVLRFATEDTELRGIQILKGERVHLLVPAGNLDAGIFQDPERIILGRDAPAITFGTGIHRCLGSHLARLELKTLFEDLLANWPVFRLDPDEPTIESAGMVYSVDRLPLRWTVPKIN